MLGLEDAIRKHPLTALGLAAVAITSLIPRSRRPTWAKGVKAAAQLCIEADGEAEAEIVERLAQVAVNDLSEALAHPEPEARHAAAHAVVRKYAKRAHRRSAHSRKESHRQRRYARHISALEEKIKLRRATAPDEQRQGFEIALSALKAPPPPYAGTGADGSKAGGSKAGGSKVGVPRAGAVSAPR